MCACVCRGGTHLVRAAVGILAGGRERKRDIEEGEKERWMGGDEKGALCALSGTQQVQIERKKDAGRKRGDFIFFSLLPWLVAQVLRRIHSTSFELCETALLD